MKRTLILLPVVLLLAACGGRGDPSTGEVAGDVQRQANLQMAGTATVTWIGCVKAGSGKFECHLDASDGSSATVAVTCDADNCVWRPLR